MLRTTLIFSMLACCVAAASAPQDRQAPRAARRPAAAAPAAPPAPAVLAPDVQRKKGEFRVEIRIAPPAGAQLLELWVPTPRQDEHQTVTAAAAPTPPGVVLDQQTDPVSGNTFLHLKVDNPTAPIEFTASWTFERREAVKSRFRRGPARDSAADDGVAFARDLVGSKLAPVTGRVKVRAGTIAPGETDPLNVARALYDEILKSLAFSAAGEGVGRGDVLWASDAGHGDATDFASLFVALARARGIPARFAMGFPLPEGAAGAPVPIESPTAWAEFFVPDLGWIPVDLADAKMRPENRQSAFGNLDERRVLFTMGRDVNFAPPCRGGPQNLIVHPYSEIDGEPFAVVHRYSFQEK